MSIIRKYHNHTLQPNPEHCGEQPKNTYSRKRPGRQLNFVSYLDKLSGCKDPDSLNKAVDLLFGLALGNKANDNPIMVSSI